MRNILIGFAFLFGLNVYGQEIKNVLRKSVAEIDKIESFEYIVISKATAAFDTTEFVSEYLGKVIGVKNNRDSIIGFSYISYWIDTSKVYSIYDFDYKVNFNWNSKSAEITDFSRHLDLRQNNSAPFYIKARTMFDFALHGNQAEFNIIKNNQDTIVFDIHFSRNRYEFQGKTVVKQGRPGYAWSTYRVWIDKKTHLPFKVLRKHEYQKSELEIKSFKLNTRSNLRIDALECIPDNFSIHEYGKSRKTPDLTGSMASDFKLLSASNDSVSLSEHLGKVVLLEFTSIGCGPCHLAISELTKLYSELDKNKFEILSIEAYLFNKRDIFQRFITKNSIEYPFLIGSKEITDLYKVRGVPYFIIIDKKGVIQNTRIGFTQEETIPQLKKIIVNLLE